MLKRMITATLVIIIAFTVFSSVFDVTAAGTATFSMKLLKYSSAIGTNVEVSSANPGDTVLLQFYSNSSIDNVGGFAVAIAYDSSLLTYSSGASICHIVDANSSSVFSKAQTIDSTHSKVVFMWDTTSANTNLNGAVFSLVFTVNSAITGSNTALFTGEVKSFFDSSAAQVSIEYSTPANVSLPLTTTLIPQSALNAFEKLKNILYPDSINDIVSAESAASQLSSAQVSLFISKYPDLYQALINARPTYNLLAQQSKESDIINAAQQFINSHADVWALDENNPNILDYADRIIETKNVYKALLLQVKVLVNDSYKQKLDVLNNKITELKDAKDEYDEALQQVSDFRNMFGYLFQLTDEMIEETYITLYVGVDNAVVATDFMNETAKTMLKNEIQELAIIKKTLDKVIAQNKEISEIREQTSAFIKQWGYVFTLNTSTVKLGDEAAINIMLDAYNELPQSAQDALNSRITNIKKLLTIIESLKQASAGETTIEYVYVDSSNSNTNSQITDISSVPAVVAGTSSDEVDSQSESAGTTYIVDGMNFIILCLSTAAFILLIITAFTYWLLRSMDRKLREVA